MEQQPRPGKTLNQELWMIGLFDASYDQKNPTPVQDTNCAWIIGAYVGMKVDNTPEDRAAGIWLAEIPETLAEELEAGLDVSITVEIGDGRYLITIATSN